MRQRLTRLAPAGVVGAAVLFLVGGIVVGGHPDEEEYRNAILTTVLHARALLDGVYPYWTSALAFGLPHPLTPALIFHPLVLLFGVAPPDVAALVLYVVHALLGAAGCWWLLCDLTGDRWAAALGAATWALSAPSQNYVLVDFWPAEFVVWSLAPFLVHASLRVLDAPPGRQPWIPATGFGLTAGLMWANGHSGYVPVFFLPLVVMFAAHPVRTVRVFPALALATGIGAVIAAPTLGQLLTEVSRFPHLVRFWYDQTIGIENLWDLVLRPFAWASPSTMRDIILERGTRVPFYGGPMFVLSLCYALGVMAVRPYRRGVVLAFASALALLGTPHLDRMKVLTATYLFRDSLVLYGIVLGSIAWHVLAKRRPRLAAVVALLQIAVIFAAAWPFVQRAGRGDHVARYTLRDTAITRSLRALAEHYPGRWYLSPRVDDLATGQRLFTDGLWPNTWIYRGLPIVNGSFKGVSADPLYPSARLPYGQIRGDAVSITSASLLNAMGISIVLAVPGEMVAPQLREIDRIATYEAGDLRVLRNPEAWPGAAFVADDVVTATLRPLPGCNATGLLCSDFAPVVRSAVTSGVRVTRAHGSIRAQFAPDPNHQRWLLVAEMYRPGWHATTDVRGLAGVRNPSATSVLGGLLAVTIPPGAATVELTFRPAWRVLLTWLAWGTIAIASCVLMAAYTATRRRAPREYFHTLLAGYLGYYLPPSSRVVDFAPRSPLLRDTLRRSGLTWMPHGTAETGTGDGLASWPALREFEADRIILNGTLHYEPDIQMLLERLRGASLPDTRLLVVYYNSLWRPLFSLGRRLGFSATGPEHNWVSPSDVENLLKVSGFELISESQRVLLPVYVPLLSTVLNRWFAPLPVFRWFTVANIALARPLPEPAADAPSVSVVVPARNERGNIAQIIERTPQMGPNDELIFVEGHSTDSTWEEIQSAIARHPGRRIVALQQPGRGKGDAVRAAFDVARGDLLMILDADLTVPPEDLPKFYRVLVSGIGEFVNGSRLVYPMDREAMQFANIIGNKFFALAFSFLLGQPLKDTLCGTKALSKRHYEQIARNRLYFGDFDPFGDFDLLFGAAKLGLRIVELPIRYGERTYGTTNIRRWAHGWLLLRMTLVAARKIKFLRESTQ